MGKRWQTIIIISIIYKEIYKTANPAKHFRYNKIEQKGMTFDNDFRYYCPLFSFLLKKGKKKRRMNTKNHDQKSCLSARSTIDKVDFNLFLLIFSTHFFIKSHKKRCSNMPFLLKKLSTKFRLIVFFTALVLYNI